MTTWLNSSAVPKAWHIIHWMSQTHNLAVRLPLHSKMSLTMVLLLLVLNILSHLDDQR
jgi:hypothetical protein